ncbi:hypothetical protein [Arthrobacter sp. NPDC058127]|uniref:hypothetical protein n=1 Tax=Arthrobacter sp. NPDC058127 TaxID=3346351 RepID=UPI0036E098F2
MGTAEVEIDESRVWHYTSPDGLKGVLRSHVIWASSAETTNDPYVLNSPAEIGKAELIFTQRARYEGRSAIIWAIDNPSEDALVEGDRIARIDHALLSYALRLRGASTGEIRCPKPSVFPDFDPAVMPI